MHGVKRNESAGPLSARAALFTTTRTSGPVSTSQRGGLSASHARGGVPRGPLARGGGGWGRGFVAPGQNTQGAVRGGSAISRRRRRRARALAFAIARGRTPVERGHVYCTAAAAAAARDRHAGAPRPRRRPCAGAPSAQTVERAPPGPSDAQAAAPPRRRDSAARLASRS